MSSMSSTETVVEDPLAIVLSELLGNALQDGRVSIKWSDAPGFIAKLTQAGVVVTGVETDYGRGKAISLSNIVIPVR